MLVWGSDLSKFKFVNENNFCDGWWGMCSKCTTSKFIPLRKRGNMDAFIEKMRELFKQQLLKEFAEQHAKYSDEEIERFVDWKMELLAKKLFELHSEGL